MLSDGQLSAMLADICETIFGSDANKMPFGKRVPDLLSYNHCCWACAIRPNPNPVSWLDEWAENHTDEFKPKQLEEWREFLSDISNALDKTE
jgi:hypothetical protein